MILIADSGASKAKWRMISPQGDIFQAQSAGYNPYHQPAEFFINELRDVLLPQIGEAKVDQVFYYGAGCSSKENIEKVKFAVSAVFKEAVVEVNHDLLAAARALCGDKPGIACILGTGANSCYYDGVAIEKNEPALGFILGDEGSGAYLGKQLLIAYIRKELPQIIIDRLNKRFELSRDIILANVYQGDAPARYMASFSKFIFQNLKEPELFRLVYHAFEQFFEKNIMKYEGYKDVPVHFTGSVAFYYGNLIRQVAADKQINVKNITEDPIAGLALYHQNSLRK